MELGLFKTVVADSGLEGKPIFLLCDLGNINEISYSYKKTITNFIYSCNLKFRMIVFCNISPNFRTMAESIQAVMPDGVETIIVNNYQEAIENIITFKAGTYRHPEPESEAERHEK
ncbi:MAG: transcriptional regulator, partial [Chlorobiaceae bacterium]|nr:transcriptional regulator [Chlorobiaceae bacterium]